MKSFKLRNVAIGLTIAFLLELWLLANYPAPTNARDPFRHGFFPYLGALSIDLFFAAIIAWVITGLLAIVRTIRNAGIRRRVGSPSVPPA